MIDVHPQAQAWVGDEIEFVSSRIAVPTVFATGRLIQFRHLAMIGKTVADRFRSLRGIACLAHRRLRNVYRECHGSGGGCGQVVAQVFIVGHGFENFGRGE